MWNKNTKYFYAKNVVGLRDNKKPFSKYYFAQVYTIIMYKHKETITPTKLERKKGDLIQY